MARPTTLGCAEVAMHFDWFGQQCENVLHFEKVTAWTGPELEALTDDLISWWTTNVLPLTTDQVALVEAVGTDLSSASGPQFPNSNTLPLHGTDHSGSQPNNVTVAIAHLTASRGRSFRGRSYFVGLSLNEVLGSQLVAGVGSTIQAAWRALRDFAFTTAGTHWVVLSEVTAGAPRANGVTTLITDVSVDNTLDSQRRRLPGRGR